VAWTPWRFVGEQRFDDPVHLFRVLYTAQQRLGCFVEAVACFRIPVTLLAAFQAQPGGTQQLQRPRIPEDWLRQRCWGSSAYSPVRTGWTCGQRRRVNSCVRNWRRCSSVSA
jgi:hypothetical protein